MNATGNESDAASGPGEIEALLPWYAAGTLSARDARRVADALARDSMLAQQYGVVREEYTETILLNESLGAPSARAMQKLFADIDTEPARAPVQASLISKALGFFASLQPRTLATASAAAAALVLLQAGVIGVLMRDSGTGYQTAAIERTAAKAAPTVLLRFAPEARADDITRFLDGNSAAIIGGPRSGLFQVRFGDKTMSKDEAADLLKRVQANSVVGFAAAE